MVQRASSGVGQVRDPQRGWRGDGLGERLPRGRPRGDDAGPGRLAEDGGADPGGQQQGQVGPRGEGVGVIALTAGNDVVRGGEGGGADTTPQENPGRGEGEGRAGAEKVLVSLGGDLAAAR